MEFYKILTDIMEEQKLNIPTVARMCGLSDGTVRSIIVRKQKNVALEVAFKLSRGLNVSLERLNGMDDNSEAQPPHVEIPDMTLHERDLLLAYRNASEDTRRIIELALKPYGFHENGKEHL